MRAVVPILVLLAAPPAFADLAENKSKGTLRVLVMDDSTAKSSTGSRACIASASRR